jgi:hypothetical protein
MADGHASGPAAREQSVSPTDHFLLCLLRRDWDPTVSPWATTDQAPDWTTIVEMALRHGVAGIVCRSLVRSPPADVPEDIVDAAGVYLAETDALGTTRVTQLFDILDELAADGMPALPFKGPVLGRLAHASATIRPSLDIDVLVHRKDMDRAVAALRRLGYRDGEGLSPRMLAAYYDYNGQIPLSCEERTPVDLHWAFAPKALDVNLDMNGLWNRASPTDVAGRRVLTLSPEDTLLIACLHGCKDKWWRLLWVTDVAAFLHRHPNLDWTAMLDRAEVAGVRRIFLLGLALARDLFSSPLPNVISSAIDHDAMCLRLVDESKSYLFGSVADVGTQNHVSRYHLNSRERIGDRVRYVWRTVTTPRVIHFRMVRLPDRLFFGYVAIKIVHDYLLLPIWNLGKGRWWRRTRDPAPDAAA